MDPLSECAAQFRQMFHRRVLPVLAFAEALQAIDPRPGAPPPPSGAIGVEVDVGLRALTAEQAETTIAELERKAGVVGVSGVVQKGLGPGHRRLPLSSVASPAAATRG